MFENRIGDWKVLPFFKSQEETYLEFMRTEEIRF